MFCCICAVADLSNVEVVYVLVAIVLVAVLFFSIMMICYSCVYRRKQRPPPPVPIPAIGLCPPPINDNPPPPPDTMRGKVTSVFVMNPSVNSLTRSGPEKKPVRYIVEDDKDIRKPPLYRTTTPQMTPQLHRRDTVDREMVAGAHLIPNHTPSTVPPPPQPPQLPTQMSPQLHRRDTVDREMLAGAHLIPNHQPSYVPPPPPPPAPIINAPLLQTHAMPGYSSLPRPDPTPLPVGHIDRGSAFYSSEYIPLESSVPPLSREILQRKYSVAPPEMHSPAPAPPPMLRAPQLAADPQYSPGIPRRNPQLPVGHIDRGAGFYSSEYIPMEGSVRPLSKEIMQRKYSVVPEPVAAKPPELFTINGMMPEDELTLGDGGQMRDEGYDSSYQGSWSETGTGQRPHSFMSDIPESLDDQSLSSYGGVFSASEIGEVAARHEPPPASKIHGNENVSRLFVAAQ